MSISLSTAPIVTAEKFIQYKRNRGHFSEFIVPKIVLICYQQSTLDDLRRRFPKIEPSEFSDLYLIDEGKVGILGGWGVGAPALAVKMEQLIVLGTKRPTTNPGFVAFWDYFGRFSILFAGVVYAS